uniref:cytochrome c oxidase subunit II n=1 Tax=Tetrameres grusi TaxID=1911024 RepID=UPI001FCDFF80|nr:cytochrome c oxidase subunit II [Tetrameres grusi]UNY39753.1 cytochrome c oxidase subunit II [Tetrameres grusi]
MGDSWVFPISGSLYSFCSQYVHNYYTHILFFGFFVMLIFSVLIMFAGYVYKFDYVYSDSRLIEMSLQFFVIFFLLLLSGPGFWLIQFQGRVFDQSELSLKVIGHQWYWSYEYGDSSGLRFDSFIKSLEDLNYGEFRLFEVDNRCVVPADVDVGFYCTSSDVIHSFSIPKCFIKMDVLNGLLSKVVYRFPLVGLFFGQCSEICGANHSFMPIVVEAVSLGCWKGWCSMMSL